MNYVIAVEAVVLVVAALTWIFDSRTTFQGPIDIDRLLARYASHHQVALPPHVPRSSRPGSMTNRTNSLTQATEPQPDADLKA